MHEGDTRAADHPAFPARCLTAYGALSPETSSCCLRRLANWRRALPGRARRTSARLGCSNDSRDHAIWPYASAPLVRTQPGAHEVHPALLPALAHDAAASTAPRSAARDDVRPPLFAGSGWPTHTSKPNFGKVEYFWRRGLTRRRNRAATMRCHSVAGSLARAGNPFTRIHAARWIPGSRFGRPE